MSTDEPGRPAPLDGITVVDMGQVLATPFATYLLALLGADVIKIEPSGGEWVRQMGAGLAFATQNADKQTVVVNMRAPDATATVLRMIDHADVFVEGFAPGTAAAMGLGWEDVAARNPRIVYGSLSAFGDTGPYAGRPGFDHVVQAVSGIMPATGFPGQPPTKVGSPYLDYGGGLLLAFGVLAGILEQRRTHAPVRIDVTMLDAGLLLNASAFVRAANTGQDPPRTGNDAFSGAIASGAVETSDGLLMIAANKPAHYVTLMRLLDLDEFADPALALPGADAGRSAAARAAMIERLEAGSSRHWEEILNAAGIPAARVRTLSEVAAEGHPATRGTVQPVTGGPGDERETLLPGVGVRINGSMPGPRSFPAPVGTHTAAVLTRCGFSGDEIRQLVEQGTVETA